MSSHHIVRENQEPALLIVDVEAIDEELLGQLLEWSPMVMTAQDHVDFLLARGIKVDVVFSTAETLESVQESTVVITSQGRDQLIGEVFTYLESKEQFAVHVLCDEASIKQTLFSDEGFTVIAFSNHTRYIAAVSFEKWLPQGQILLIENDRCATQGLEQIDGNEYRVVKDGFVRITSINGQKLWIGERL